MGMVISPRGPRIWTEEVASLCAVRPLLFGMGAARTEKVTDGGMERGVRPIWEGHFGVVVKGREGAVRWKTVEEVRELEGKAS